MTKPLYDRIIVPLDGSAIAESALLTAMSLASALGVPVLLLRIVDFTKLERYGPYGLALDYATYEPVVSVEERDALDYLEGIKQGAGHDDVSISIQITRGAVVREIVEVARPQDLIVLASHGRSGLSRWLLGSVAEDIVRNGQSQVLLVRAGSAEITEPQTPS